MKKNNVKINTEVQINVYPNIAYPLYFILNESKMKGWYYEHFINIYAQSWGDFFRIDYLDSSRYFGDILDRRSYRIEDLQGVDIIDFIRENIDNGFGLNIFTVDEYYLPDTAAYNNYHIVHETLIYGYDDGEGKVLARGYNDSEVFTDVKYDYGHFRTAFQASFDHPPDYLIDCLHTIRPRDFAKSGEYPFDMTRFMEEFGKFIHSTPDTKKSFFSIASKDPASFGLAAYDKMLEVMRNTIAGDDSSKINYIAFHFMYEHKKVLEERFRYISQLYGIRDTFASLVDRYASLSSNFVTLKNTFLKDAMKESNFTSRLFINKRSTLEKLLTKTAAVRTEENELLFEIYASLASRFK